MFDPLHILLGLILIALIALCVIFYVRSHPVAQAGAMASLPPEWAARLKVVEDALPTKADLQAEEAKLQADLAPIKAKMEAAEQDIADWLRSKGWTVSKG